MLREAWGLATIFLWLVEFVNRGQLATVADRLTQRVLRRWVLLRCLLLSGLWKLLDFPSFFGRRAAGVSCWRGLEHWKRLVLRIPLDSDVWRFLGRRWILPWWARTVMQHFRALAFDLPRLRSLILLLCWGHVRARGHWFVVLGKEHICKIVHRVDPFKHQRWLKSRLWGHLSKRLLGWGRWVRTWHRAAHQSRSRRCFASLSFWSLATGHRRVCLRVFQEVSLTNLGRPLWYVSATLPQRLLVARDRGFLLRWLHIHVFVHLACLLDHVSICCVLRNRVVFNSSFIHSFN